MALAFRDDSGNLFADEENVEAEEGGGFTNIWVSGRAWNNIQLKAIVEEDPRLISSFDVSLDALVVGCYTGDLALVDNLNLI